MKSKILRWMSVFMIILVATLPLTLAAQTSFTYDDNGNVVYDGETYREYNSLNQLWKVYNASDNTTLITSYEYHPTEERVHVKRNYNSSGYLLETIIYVSDTFVMKVNDTGTYEEVYVHLNGELIGQEINNKKEFISGDHLSSSSVLTNSTGSVIESSTYDPHGLVLSGASETRFDYESRENEPFGTMDFRFRHYNPEHGIFYQPDSLMLNRFNPQNINRFSFETGNPYRYIDPSGHFGLSIHLGADVSYLIVGGGIGLDIGVSYTRKSGFQGRILSSEGSFNSLQKDGSHGYGLVDISGNVGLTFVGWNSDMDDLIGPTQLKGFSAALGPLGVEVEWTDKSFTLAWAPGYALEYHNYLTTTENVNFKNRQDNADEASKMGRGGSGGSTIYVYSSSSSQCGRTQSCESQTSSNAGKDSQCGVTMSCE